MRGALGGKPEARLHLYVGGTVKARLDRPPNVEMEREGRRG